MLAWLAARQGAQRSDTIFTYNRILQEDDSLGILWPITASELAIEYLLDDRLEAAAYYAQAAMEHIEGFVPRRSGSTSAYLVILTNAAYFYRKSQNYQSACKLAQEGIDLSRQKYIIGLIDKLYINLAYALAGTERRWNGEAIKALHMAYAFASHINNQEICQEAETELRKQGWLQYS
ncbi:hypothetical protein LFYK43_09230 [Ligilactobacillus salitolerans]|uniref:MalT-like TPR region domain-containing protein n=1 Tax=Ligilactobacillus salitolerans TaxID=1808352 RepID=A0A401ISH4_9LACO|nr:hypothetical protein [Ligilactobacillus salitolerans]GBG94464.1 hypothetical protein LFYK43_09230 [Ligilactobacillus salitolerans]